VLAEGCIGEFLLNWRKSIEQHFANRGGLIRLVTLTVGKQASALARGSVNFSAWPLLASWFAQTTRDNMREQAALQSIPIAAIRLSPFQYRTRFDDEKQRQLIESLRTSGLSTPILVRPLAEAGTFELVSGERRLRAAKELGWETIQGVCEGMTDAEAAARVVTENEVRSDANIMEKAAGYKRLTQPPCNFSFEEIARRYGWSSGTSVKRVVDLLDEPKPIQELLSRDRIGETHMRYLSRIKDPRVRARLARRAAEEGWTVKMLEQRVGRKLGNAPKVARASNGKAAKRGATYEDDYNHFHCALFGDQIELSGRRFKMNEEMLDQYVADYRAALESFVRDVRERLTTSSACEGSGPPASSIQPSPAEISTTPAPVAADVQKTSVEVGSELRDDAANFLAAGGTIKDILSQILKPPAPTSTDPSGDGTAPVKAPEPEEPRK